MWGEMRVTRSPDPLWLPIVAPVVWSMHFMVCYVWAALACGRFSALSPALATGITASTAVSVLIISTLLVHGLRRLDHTLPDHPNDNPTPEDRTKFMAFTTVLLAGLSLIGTMFVAAAIWAIGGCQ